MEENAGGVNSSDAGCDAEHHGLLVVEKEFVDLEKNNGGEEGVDMEEWGTVAKDDDVPSVHGLGWAVNATMFMGVWIPMR